MSKCQISDAGAVHISQLLSNPSLNLKALVLHWNHIRGKGSIQLAKALKRNQSLQIFDASFNSFGTGALKQKAKTPRKEQESEAFTVAALKWSKALALNTTLVHVDFSFNNFKEHDIRIIGEGLKENHSILGIHLMGNEAKVDELGFVTPEKVMDAATCHVFTRIPGKIIFYEHLLQQVCGQETSRANSWSTLM